MDTDTVQFDSFVKYFFETSELARTALWAKQGIRQVEKFSMNIFSELGARINNGILAAEPQSAFRGSAAGQGIRGSPLKLKTFHLLDIQRKQHICLIHRMSQTP